MKKRNCFIGQSGGPTTAINASLAGIIAKCIETQEFEHVYGMINGIKGLIEHKYMDLLDIFKTEENINHLKHSPAMYLGSCRYKLPTYQEDPQSYESLFRTFEELEITDFYYIGGNDSMDTVAKLSTYAATIQSPIRFIGIPKTIDNDVWGTDITFGFDTAVNIATDAIDRLHSTASSHKRVMVVEVMGHHAGWIALYAGMAGGADVILLPELGYDMDKVNQTILDRAHRGKPYSIVVVAEGVETPDKKRPSDYITRTIEAATGIESRDTVLGYIQRGGNPSPFDRNLATRLGGHATELIANHQFGRMVCMKGNNVESIALSEVAGKLKLVIPEHDLIIQGERMGISFGK